jgi:DNA-binding response OmpR family regulator
MLDDVVKICPPCGVGVYKPLYAAGKESGVPRIAVIDSDVTLLQLTTDVFAERGWETVALADPDTALAALALSRPDVVMMDIWLTEPGSGWPILRQLHEEPATRDIPVIVWSAVEPSVLDRDGWLHDHGIPVLGKPFELAELFAAVECALTGAAAWHAS